jgi:hypothetical protein
MKTIKESKTETSRSNDTYSAPRVLALGTAVELLQGSWSGSNFESGQPPFRR